MLVKKILLIDDEPKITRAFQDMFAFETDYQINIANDGAQGLQLIQTKHPDFVVLDWRLNSEIEGKDVLRFLKEKHPEIPVFVVTASVHYLKEIEAFKPNATYLKPCPDLKEKILSILS